MGRRTMYHSRKSNVSSLGPELVAHGKSSIVHHLPVPRGSDGVAARECGNEIRSPERRRSILQTQATEVETCDRVDIAHTRARLAGDWAELAPGRSMTGLTKQMHIPISAFSCSVSSATKARAFSRPSFQPLAVEIRATFWSVQQCSTSK